MLKEARSSSPRKMVLNAFLVFKCALFVMIRQTPARFDAEKWPAIGPES